MEWVSSALVGPLTSVSAAPLTLRFRLVTVAAVPNAVDAVS